MQLTEEEKAILNGEPGQIKQQDLQTLVRYGETFLAERLGSITRGQVVMPAGLSFMPSQLEILGSGHLLAPGRIIIYLCSLQDLRLLT